MGCYGIGISRILAASVEVLGTDSEIRWPKLIAPYSVCVIAPKVIFKTQNFAIQIC
jgi:prolyl-tRNA synthetase